jgi:hypothetical protein
MMDRTVNTSGPNNRPPALPIAVCANTILVDGLIKDKWIDPDLRDQEIIALYQGQMKALSRQLYESQKSNERRIYANNWVARWLEDTETLQAEGRGCGTCP